MENDKKLELELDPIEKNQEETTTEEPTEEVVTIPKKDFTRLNRKAIAYDATKKQIINKSEPDDEALKRIANLEMIESKRQFGFENGLSPEETDIVFQFSQGKPSKDTLEHPFIKAGLEQLRAAKRVESNTPSSVSHSPLFGNKPFSELSIEERRKAFEQRMSNFK